MKKLICIIGVICLIGGSGIVNAQSYQWAFNAGGTSADNGRGIAVDGSGNCYVTGYFQGISVDFNPGAGTAFLTSAGE